MDGHQADAIGPLLDDRRFRRLPFVGRLREAPRRTRGTKCPPESSVLARQLGNVQRVGQHLLARAPQRKPDMRARRFEQPGHRLGHGPPVSLLVQLGDHAERRPIGSR